MKLALSILCENPNRRTGLTTMFEDFLSNALLLYPQIEWVVFAGPNSELHVADDRVRILRQFPAGDRLAARLFADHFRVSPAARKMGVQGLFTVGFVPIRSVLPTFMILISLQHLRAINRIGLMRTCYRHWIARRSMEHAALVITNSKAAQAELLANHPECKDKLVVSHDCTRAQYQPAKPADEEERLRRQFGFGPGYLLWVSNFYPYKQAPLLIRAYANLPAEARARMPLVMVGGDWLDGLAEAQSTAQACGVSNSVRFHGWVAEEWLAPLYRNALAFCLPSREETFGRCTAEAMACGTPCILNDIPVNHEVSGGHALIVDFNKPDLVTAALRRMLDDAAMRRGLREAGIAHARQFSPENMTRTRLDPVIKMLTGRNS